MHFYGWTDSSEHVKLFDVYMYSAVQNFFLTLDLDLPTGGRLLIYSPRAVSKTVPFGTSRRIDLLKFYYAFPIFSFSISDV